MRIFGDPDRHRGPFVIAAGYFTGIGLLVWASVFFANLVLQEPLQELRFDDPAAFRAPDFGQLFPGTVPRETPVVPAGVSSVDSRIWPRATPGKTYAFVTSWPLQSFESLREHLKDIDGIFLDGLAVSSDGNRLELKAAKRRANISGYIDSFGQDKSLLAVVNGMERAFGKDTAGLIQSMVRKSIQGGYDGLCLDLAGLPEGLMADSVTLLRDLKAAFAPIDKQVCVILDLVGRPWPLAQIDSQVDLVVILPFDRPGTGDIPDSIAPLDRFATETVQDLALISPQKRILAFGNIGVDWISGNTLPRTVSFAEVLRRSDLHNKPVRVETAGYTPFMGYVSAGGERHQIFFTDATTVYNQLRMLEGVALHGAAIWPLGGEDPGFWDLLDPAKTAPVAALLQEVDITDYVGTEGQGGFFTVLGTPHNGQRRITVDRDTGLVMDQKYTQMPQTYTLAYWGGDMRNRIALTFDDGPDAVYTPQILDILRRENVPAAFFMIGEKVLVAPDLVRMVIADGHEIGVHTFTHPNISMISETRLVIEANATQHLLANVSGRNTFLFRAPYGEDRDPSTALQASPVARLTKDGYIHVGMQIDPQDWHRPGLEAIVDATLERAIKSGGGIVLLHDGGGDRMQTIAALPHIISSLRAEGFVFATLAEMLGTTTDRIMPPVPPAPDGFLSFARFDSISFALGRWVTVFLKYAFVTAITLGLVRTVLIVFFALVRRRPVDDHHRPAVTVLVPAYNEEPVIVRTIEAVLASDYPAVKVIVINDGSTDATYDLANDTFRNDPRVTVLTQENQGKAVALNTGFARADTEVIVAIDADTQILPDAITRLARHFADASVGAVAGNTKVGNRINLLTRLQAVEYITSQNLDRRAFERPNAILVVPGAIGAWRRSAVLAAGGYCMHTLAEDADMTVAIIRSGYRVIYDAEAIAMTEAPETLRQLMNQRLRWTLGIMQVAWKHRRALREGNGIGLVAMPNIVIFGTLLPLLAPFADLVFLVAAVRIIRDFLQHPTMAWGLFSPTVVGLYVIYLLSDVVLSAIAFMMEPKEDKRLLFWVVFQRFFYRQILYIAVLRSLWRAMTGRLSGWLKVTRTADVQIPAARYAQREMALHRISPRKPDSPMRSMPRPRPDNPRGGS